MFMRAYAAGEPINLKEELRQDYQNVVEEIYMGSAQWECSGGDAYNNIDIEEDGE